MSSHVDASHSLIVALSRWHLPALCAAVLLLRLPMLGDQPYTDEGIYAAAGYFDFLTYTGRLPWAGWLLPRDGHLNLYPLLTSWVHQLPAPPLASLRAIDAGVAVLAVFAIYRFLCFATRDGRCALVGGMFLALAMNHPLVANAGFKNSIPLALTLLALALCQLWCGGLRGCAWAGVLMALAVLVREFFLPMATLLALLALHREGWRGFVRYAVFGMAAGLSLVAILVALRGQGGLVGFIQAYVEYNGALAASGDRFALAAEQSALTVSVLLPLLPMGIVGLFAPLLHRWRTLDRANDLYVVGWLLALCPIAEILYKPAFAYHFAQSAIGLAILAALGFRAFLTNTDTPGAAAHKRHTAVVWVVAFTTVVLLPHYLRPFYWQAASAQRFAPVMLADDWTSPVAQQSLYLRAAQFVRQNTPRDSSLMTDWTAGGLFPLTGRLPTIVGLGNLSRVASRAGTVRADADASGLSAAPPYALLVVPRSAESDNVVAWARNLGATYPYRVLLPAGLSPYGAWTTEVYLRGAAR